MMRDLSRRIARMENTAKPPTAVPNVIFVRRGETIDEANAQYAAKWAPFRRGHSVLIVPARDQTDEDHADFAERFKIQQLQSVANAKSQRPTQSKELAPC